MSSDDDVQIPPESKLLKQAQKTSGLSGADLAEATGLSRGTVYAALQGVHYKKDTKTGKSTPIAGAPTLQTLVKLAGVLRINPDQLREIGHDRAAAMLAESTQPEHTRPADEQTQAAIAARAGLARQVLSAFSTNELQAEIDRREAEASTPL